MTLLSFEHKKAFSRKKKINSIMRKQERLSIKEKKLINNET